MVGTSGLEPPTSRLSGARSNLLSYEPIWIEVTPAPWRRGGDDGIRTHDPLLAGLVLSQLSYTPIDGIPSVSPFRSLKIEQQFDVPFKTRSRPSGFCLPIYKLQ